MKKITLFTDFDGVLHPSGSCVWDAEKQQMQASNAFRWWSHLKDVFVGYNIELVIHSTWRLMWETDTELLAMLPVSMRPFITGVTDRNIMSRAASIEAYVKENSISHFLVLDDEPKAFSMNYKKLIGCDPKTGVSSVAVQQHLTDRLKCLLKEQ